MLLFNKNSELERLKYFWRSVVGQAIADTRSKSVTLEKMQLKFEALAWVAHDKENFDLVCDYSGLCKTLARRRIIEFAKTQKRRGK